MRIDRFETVDSSLGAEDTDKLLEELGRRLQHAGRAEDTLAYLGGGSLAALLPGAAGPAEATAVVGSILSAVAEPITVGRHELFLTLSMGVAIYPSDGVSAVELLRNADAAMHRASDEGGDRWQFFHSGMNAERRDRLELDAELHRALDADQFFLEYQPVVNAATEEIVAVEALVRWRHPERGIVQPMDFIPAAEDSGVLIPIGAWILEEACRQGRAWQRRFGSSLRMSVNISARQLHEKTLVDTVRRILRTTRFDPRSLELEITETAAMRDARHTAQILGALRAMGVRIALDDFGTGYSSLSHLVRLPISTREDRQVLRARPPGRARARRGGRVGDRPRPSSRPDGGGRGRRDRRRARRPARRGLRRHPGLPLQQAGPGGGVRRAPRGGSDQALSGPAARDAGVSAVRTAQAPVRATRAKPTP